MKNIISSIALIAMIAAPALADVHTKKKTTVKTTTTTSSPAITTTTSEPVTTTASSTSYPTHSYHGVPELSADLGLGTIAKKFNFGVGFKAQWPTSIDGNAFKFGAQTGFYFGPSSPTSFTIPILATAQYQFATSSSIKPYLGLGIGISITHFNGDTVSFNNGNGNVVVASSSATNVDFSFMFMPGVNFSNEAYYFEVPIGTMANNFAIIPSFGMHF